MPRIIAIALAVCCCLSGLGVSPQAWSQDESQRRSELGERQRLVERNMAELEAQFVRVAESLQGKEPERAQRLVAALQEAKQRLIAKRMGEITAMLDANRLTEAEQAINQIVGDLDQLVKLLLNSASDEMSKKEEIQSLEEWKQQLNRLKNEQQQQTRETGKIAHQPETLKDLDAKIAQVKQLIAEQQAVAEATTAQSDASPRALDRIADKQFDVRLKTESILKEISLSAPIGDPSESQPNAGESPNESEPNQPNTNQPNANQPNASQPNASQPNASQPNASQPNASQPNASQPNASQPNASQPNASQPNASQPNASQPNGAANPSSPPSESSESGSESAPKQPGQQPLQNAVQNQQQAETKLTEGNKAEAERAEQKAVSDLERALAELERERRRIESLPPEALAKLAPEQRITRDKTFNLAEQMAKAKKPNSAENGGEQNASSGKQAGQQQVEEASQSMQNAAQGLESEDGAGAERQQKQAEKKLDEAMREIEERLNQLREETRQEKLARLEARFNEMLTRQREATQTTIDVDDKKNSLGSLPRRDLLNLIRLAVEEQDLRELGQQAYDLLVEDGTSSVFPECVQDLREDLGQVALLLEGERTDQLTQMIQRDIESALEDLLDALQQARNQEEGGGGGGGGGGKQPLLRKSAELKMLRAAQLRVNRRTTRFEAIRPEETLDPSLTEEIRNIAARQHEIQTMAEEVMTKDQE